MAPIFQWPKHMTEEQLIAFIWGEQTDDDRKAVAEAFTPSWALGEATRDETPAPATVHVLFPSAIPGNPLHDAIIYAVLEAA